MILETTGLSASNLRPEVTESVLIGDIAAARATVAGPQGIVLIATQPMFEPALTTS